MAKQFKGATIISKEAVWISLPCGDFLCKHLDHRSPHYQRVLQKHTAGKEKLIQHKLLTDDQDREIVVKTFVEACVIDWAKVFDSDGNAVPYTFEDCVDMLTQSSTTLYELMDECGLVNNYQLTSGDAKNSKPVSRTH